MWPRPKTERLAEVLDFPFDWSAGSDQRRQAAMLLYTARTDNFAGSTAAWDGVRRDQQILDHLSASGVPLFDMNAIHQREYEQASGSYHEYLSRYMVGDGHYNPRGNHFFAYELKDALLELLDPKPLPYQDRGPHTVDLSRYLPHA